MRRQPKPALNAVETPAAPGSRAHDPRRLLLAAGVATLATGVAGLALLSTAGSGRAGTAPVASRQALAALPVAARAPVSAALGAHDPGYRVVGLRARNPPQGLTSTFSRTGVSVASGSAHMRMKLIGFGYQSALRDVGSAAPRTAVSRVNYRHRGVDEWYANGPLGLEQGFDVGARPTTGRGALSLSLAFTSRRLVEESGHRARRILPLALLVEARLASGDRRA